MFEQDLTTRDVAAMLSLNRVTVQRLLNEGRIRGYLIGRTWRVPKESIDEFRSNGMRSVGRPRGATPLPISQTFDDWEAALKSGDDLASVLAVPIESMSRKNIY